MKYTWSQRELAIRWHIPIHETDEQAEQFSTLMNGRTFDTIKTRSYGRIYRPEPTLVPQESSLARCG
jgi:hypothetical protein